MDVSHKSEMRQAMSLLPESLKLSKKDRLCILAVDLVNAAPANDIPWPVTKAQIIERLTKAIRNTPDAQLEKYLEHAREYGVIVE